MSHELREGSDGDHDDDDDADMMMCWWSSIMVMMRLMMRWCYDDDLYRLKLVLKVLFGQPLPPNLLIWWLTHWTEGYAEGAICATPPKQFAHRHKTVKIKWRQFRTWEDPGLKSAKLSSLKKTGVKSKPPVFATPPTRNAHFWSKIKILTWRWAPNWCIGVVY